MRKGPAIVAALAALGWVYQAAQLQRIRRRVERTPNTETVARTILRDVVDQLPGGKATAMRILDDIRE